MPVNKADAVADPPPTLSVESILTAPVTQPISAVEDKIFGGLVSRLRHQHQSSVGLPFFTGGRRSHLSITPAASHVGPTPDWSLRTKERQHQVLRQVEELVARALPWVIKMGALLSLYFLDSFKAC